MSNWQNAIAFQVSEDQIITLAGVLTKEVLFVEIVAECLVVSTLNPIHLSTMPLSIYNLLKCNYISRTEILLT